jgi:hypothetical protein
LERSSALADACVQIGQASSQDAVEAATHFGVEDQDGCLEHIVQRWATQDAAGAVAWVSQLPAGSERDGLMAGMATAVAHVSPVAAVDAVADEISSESLREEATISIVHEWGLQDPAAASAWASQLPEGPVADRAKRELAGISEYGLASGR